MRYKFSVKFEKKTWWVLFQPIKFFGEKDEEPTTVCALYEGTNTKEFAEKLAVLIEKNQEYLGWRQ